MRLKFVRLIVLVGAMFAFTQPLSAQQSFSQFDAAMQAAIDLYADDDYLGAILGFTDAFELAATSIQQAAAINWRGYVFLVLGVVDRALPDLEFAVRFDSSRAEYYIDRSIAYAELERDNAAIQGFGRAMELEPGLAYPSDNPLTTTAYESYLDLYGDVIVTHPNNIIALAFRGNLYAHLEQYDDAIAHYQSVLRQMPDFEIVQASLEAAERASGEESEPLPDQVEPPEQTDSSQTDCSIAGIDGLPIIDTGETLEGSIDTLLYLYLYCLRIDSAPVTVTFTMSRADGDLLPLVGVYNEDDLIASTELFYPIGTSEVELVVTFDTPGDYLLAATRLNVRNGFSFGNFVLTIRTEGGGDALPAVCENPTFQDVNKCQKAEDRLGE